jgi:hypothetical protein
MPARTIEEHEQAAREAANDLASAADNAQIRYQVPRRQLTGPVITWAVRYLLNHPPFGAAAVATILRSIARDLETGQFKRDGYTVADLERMAERTRPQGGGNPTRDD